MSQRLWAYWHRWCHVTYHTYWSLGHHWGINRQYPDEIRVRIECSCGRRFD